MTATLHDLTTAAVLLLSVYSIAKIFLFLLPYERRRAALDRSYAGRAYATGASDIVLLVVVVVLAALVLSNGGEPIGFLGGLFVGATLIQLFFHAFHAPVGAGREAPEPRSPLKRMSYAIQDCPRRAWKEMATYVAIVGAAVVLYAVR